MKKLPHSVVLLLLWPACLAADEAARVDFSRDVQPIFQAHCHKCHGETKQKGSLRFDGRDGALRKGDSVEKAVVPGSAATSELIRRVTSSDETLRMPPEGEPLTPKQIDVLRRWINAGADWPQATTGTSRTEGQELTITPEDRRHWAYLPLRSVAIPKVQNANWCRTPIDRFILEKLEAAGLAPAPLASSQVLVRRLYFDVIGLPPKPEEVAFGELVDQLLNSRHYGERWGRHWLDVARYADSDGLETDADRPNAYHYRDFVIRALNDDLSYRTFVRWQLAGDEYEPDNPQALAATGFLTGAPIEMLADTLLEDERLRLRFNELDDMAATTATAFLGLTLGCARCHDHKFDAIPTRDYYRLQCAFTTTARDKNLLLATRDEASRFREQDAEWNQRLKAAQTKLNDWLSEQKQPHTMGLRHAKIDALPINEDQKKLLKEQPDSDAAKKLAKQHEKALTLSDDDYRRLFDESQRSQWDVLAKKVAAVQQTRPQSPPTALAIADKQADPVPTWLLGRGDFYAKNERVQLGFLSVLTNQRTPEDYWTAARRGIPPGRSTGQRRALADWLTDAEHGAGALLARVIVNRMWQHHFGEGLVRTVNDFGVRSEPPTHPELLEWLAHEFVSSGWRLKSLHRLILTSSVYRQGTAFNPQSAQVDPDNRLLWRRRPQRLEAEILRDTVLAVSGMLNLEPFGPAFKPPIPAEAMFARNTKDPYPLNARDTPATRRRTVYMFHKRVVQHPLMQAFDGPDASVSCGRRNTTTVAPQALALLNDPFLRDRATDFARRLIEKGNQPDDWVTHGYQLALSRAPTDVERKESVQFVQTQINRRLSREKSEPLDEVRVQALADFCQALFGLNEFVYVD